MVFQNYQNLIEMTSNIIDIFAFGVGIKCPRKIHLNTQCPPPKKISEPPSALIGDFYTSQYAYTQYMRKFLITFRRIVAQSKLVKLI